MLSTSYPVFLTVVQKLTCELAVFSGTLIHPALLADLCKLSWPCEPIRFAIPIPDFQSFNLTRTMPGQALPQLFHYQNGDIETKLVVELQ